jgi:hypothetical protein
MATIHYEKLSPQVKKKMKDRAYSVEELQLLQEGIKMRRLEKMKAFKRVIIIMSIIFVMLIGMTFMSAMKMPNVNMSVIVMTSVMTAVICVMVLILTKFLGVDLVRNQFMNQIKKNYPEHANLFGADSFE